MEKTIKTKTDVMKLLAEIKSELHYFANSETIQAFEKVLSEWGFNIEDFQQDI